MQIRLLQPEHHARMAPIETLLSWHEHQLRLASMAHLQPDCQAAVRSIGNVVVCAGVCCCLLCLVEVASRPGLHLAIKMRGEPDHLQAHSASVCSCADTV